MTFSTNNLERLELIQQHRLENDLLRADKRSKREALTHQQRQETIDLSLCESNFMAKVALMRCHISENMEFRLLSDEKYRRLHDQHEQELLDLTERQSRDKSTS